MIKLHIDKYCSFCDKSAFMQEQNNLYRLDCISTNKIEKLKINGKSDFFMREKLSMLVYAFMINVCNE